MDHFQVTINVCQLEASLPLSHEMDVKSPFAFLFSCPESVFKSSREFLCPDVWEPWRTIPSCDQEAGLRRRGGGGGMKGKQWKILENTKWVPYTLRSA